MTIDDDAEPVYGGKLEGDGDYLDDLRIVLWSEYLWGDNGHEVSLTLEEIIEEPAHRHEVGCGGMEPHAGVGEVEQVRCLWGRIRRASAAVTTRATPHATRSEAPSPSPVSRAP